MSNLTVKNEYSLESYMRENHKEIEDSMISIRLMKQVDDFISDHDIKKSSLAERLGVSKSYITQLMTGVKKFNVSFIQKFESSYNVEIDFKIKPVDDYITLQSSFDSFSEFDIKLEKRVQGFSNYPLAYIPVEKIESDIKLS